MTDALEAPIHLTPLTDAHRALGARLIEFGGWLMPVQYGSIIDEHRTVRRNLNCVCHVASQVRFGIDKLHGAPAQDEAWPNEHRIANFLRYGHGLFSACGRSVGSLA